MYIISFFNSMDISSYYWKHIVGFECIKDFTDFLQWLEINTIIRWLWGNSPTQAKDTIKCVKYNMKSGDDFPYILMQEDMLYGSMSLLNLPPKTGSRIHFSELVNQWRDGTQSRFCF